ncbi:fumarylacetoacetate hydrolase family protein [Streptomyces sp. A73]|uniref:2-keto-4-pentenoate hydratase n=1 Tax=unclassified Streptomyces TaxID=2593676 RepID=UPI000C3F8AAA|nr:MULTISPECIES: fumarylacetoacetate hydrolase family protein [unclassified Streptomyces]MBQ0863561.1 fumarylacetoacetate hydrolase family protein [Streptomyces sp. RK75]MBQ1122102.1 fumarylacetoacetate hydrolase family protein [Streptomyces sp. B15]MBQ1158080.1 fumarylacetoacetate hydrolase family protein [Streptomyces sp. A73]
MTELPPGFPAAARIDAAAAQLTEALRTRTPCPPVREHLGATDVDAAYEVQRRLATARTEAGARRVGAKIGLTARAVQQQFGVHQPDFGVLFDDMIHGHTEPLPLDRFLQPRAEGEIAFVLGRDLEQPGASVADVLRATAFVLPAIEIVDSRIADWDLTLTDTVADNASSGAVVLGTTPCGLDGRDLARVGMTLHRDGEPASFGAGHACLGSPVVAVVWLARELARRGRPLRAGDVVMSGALGPMVPVDGPGRFRLELDGVGEVEALIEEPAEPAQPEGPAGPTGPARPAATAEERI